MSGSEVPTSSAVMYAPPSISTVSPKSSSTARRSSPVGGARAGRQHDHALAAAERQARDRGLEGHRPREPQRVAHRRARVGVGPHAAAAERRAARRRVDGDDRVQARPPPAADEQRLVGERFLGVDGGEVMRAARRQCSVGGVPPPGSTGGGCVGAGSLTGGGPRRRRCPSSGAAGRCRPARPPARAPRRRRSRWWRASRPGTSGAASTGSGAVVAGVSSAGFSAALSFFFLSACRSSRWATVSGSGLNTAARPVVGDRERLGRRLGGRRRDLRGRLGRRRVVLAREVRHLDGAAGGDDRRAHDGGDLAGADAADRHGTAADGRAARGRAAAGAAEAQQLGADHRQRTGADRAERGERALHAAQRRAVLGAGVAGAHVAPGAAGGLHAAVVGVQQVDADLVAVGVARLGGFHQADPGAHEQRLDGRDRDVERRRQVDVGHAVDLAHQQRRALLLGQPADVGDQARQVLAPLGGLDRVVQRLARHVEHVGGGRHRAAQVVDAAVVGDAVQPRPHVDLARVGPQRAVRADVDVLQHVLGILARPRAQHLPDVGEQALAIAVVDHAERVVAPGPEQRQELLVGAQAQQRRRDRETSQTCWCVEGGRFHCRRL